MQNWVRRLSIQKKLFTLYAIGLGVFCLYFLATIAISSSNKQEMSKVVSIRLPVIEKSELLARMVHSIRTQMLQSALAVNADGISALESLHRASSVEFHLLNDVATDEDKKDLGMVLTAFEANFADGMSVLQDVVAGLETVSGAQAKFEKVSSDFAAIESRLSAIKSRHEYAMRASVEKARSVSHFAVILGLCLSVGGIPFTVLFLRTIHAINRNLRDAAQRLQHASSKILEISHTAQVSSHELADNNSEQAESVQASVANIEQMKSMLSRTLAHSDAALESSGVSFDEANRGRAVVTKMLEAMVDIERSHQELHNFNQLVHEIRNKTKIINEIVFKTQLLSFNASIEAARAGQHGRGFSVVAEEVGSLAKMSGTAAAEIESMLEQSIYQVEITIERARKKVETASELSHGCAQAFQKITDRTGKTKNMVSSIREASVEQYTGVQSVGQSMNQLNLSAAGSDELSQSIARLSKMLKSESAGLVDTVAQLHELVRGYRDPSVKTKSVALIDAIDIDEKTAA